jgi:hypothetical protein
MDPSEGEEVKQASVTADLNLNAGNSNPSLYSQVGGRDSPIAVLVELLRQVSPLRSEEPEHILQFFVRIEETFELGLVDDRSFVTRILPLVSGNVLRFWGIA